MRLPAKKTDKSAKAQTKPLAYGWVAFAWWRHGKAWQVDGTLTKSYAEALDYCALLERRAEARGAKAGSVKFGVCETMCVMDGALTDEKQGVADHLVVFRDDSLREAFADFERWLPAAINGKGVLHYSTWVEGGRKHQGPTKIKKEGGGKAVSKPELKEYLVSVRVATADREQAHYLVGMMLSTESTMFSFGGSCRVNWESLHAEEVPEARAPQVAEEVPSGNAGGKEAVIVRDFVYMGFRCVVNFHNGGVHCGYVEIPAGHKLHGVHYNRKPLKKVNVHGGLTYSNQMPPLGLDAAPGWWIGFDCKHHGDAPNWDLAREQGIISYAFYEKMKKLDAGFYEKGCTFKDADYVEAELRRLVEQLGEEGGEP